MNLAPKYWTSYCSNTGSAIQCMLSNCLIQNGVSNDDMWWQPKYIFHDGARLSGVPCLQTYIVWLILSSARNKSLYFLTCRSFHYLSVIVIVEEQCCFLKFACICNVYSRCYWKWSTDCSCNPPHDKWREGYQRSVFKEHSPWFRFSISRSSTCCLLYLRLLVGGYSDSQWTRRTHAVSMLYGHMWSRRTHAVSMLYGHTWSRLPALRLEVHAQFPLHIVVFAG